MVSHFDSLVNARPWNGNDIREFEGELFISAREEKKKGKNLKRATTARAADVSAGICSRVLGILLGTRADYRCQWSGYFGFHFEELKGSAGKRQLFKAGTTNLCWGAFEANECRFCLLSFSVERRRRSNLAPCSLCFQMWPLYSNQPQYLNLRKVCRKYAEFQN